MSTATAYADPAAALPAYPATPNGTTQAEHDKRFPSGGFKSFGHFAWAVAKSGRRGQPGVGSAVAACKQWDSLLHKQMEIKSPDGSFEESDPDGGLLVPPQWSQDLYQRTYDQNQLLKYLSPIPVEGRTMSFPALKEDSRVDGSRHGGTLGYWQGEADQYTKSQPKLRMLGTQLHKLTVLVYVTNELVEDTPQALEGYLTPNAAAEINFKINGAIVQGTGNGMPLGIMSSHIGSRITTAALSGQGAGTIIAQNVVGMVNRVVPAFRRKMVWLYNPEAEQMLIRMYVGTGQYAAANLIDYDDDGVLHMCGRPALLIEQCSAVGTEGDLIAFAPDGYKSIIKRGIESFMSIHLSFDYDQSVYKFRFRFDGQPADDVPLTPFNGSNTTSAIVTLSSTRT